MTHDDDQYQKDIKAGILLLAIMGISLAIAIVDYVLKH